MKAFAMSLVLLVAIAALASAGSKLVPVSARDAFTDRGNVRL